MFFFISFYLSFLFLFFLQCHYPEVDDNVDPLLNVSMKCWITGTNKMWCCYRNNLCFFFLFFFQIACLFLSHSLTSSSSDSLNNFTGITEKLFLFVKRFTCWRCVTFVRPQCYITDASSITLL